MNGSNELALVVFVWADELFGEDVRILPVFSGPAHVAMASERDVVVPAGHNSLAVGLLVNCWNEHVISRRDLETHVGDLDAKALEAARAVEMIGIEPEAAAGFTTWVGKQLNEGNDLRMNARREYYARWQDIRSRLALFQHAYRVTVTAPRNGGELFRGEEGFTGEFSIFTVSVGFVDLSGSLVGARQTTTASNVSATDDDDMTLQAA